MAEFESYLVCKIDMNCGKKGSVKNIKFSTRAVVWMLVP